MIGRRHLLGALGGAAAAATARPARAEADERRVAHLLEDLLIVDAHVDTPRVMVDEGYDLGALHDEHEADIPRLRRGRVGAVFFGIPARPEEHAGQPVVQRSLALVDAVHEAVRRHPGDLALAGTADDILRIRRAGRIAVLMGVEGGHQIADDLRLLRTYHRLGVRYLTLTHFQSTGWAEASTDRRAPGGLGPFGAEVVAEMNRLGMMVDVSHVSAACLADVLRASRAPVIASHSSLRAICDTPRNLSDDLVRAIAARGGVVFVNFSVAYLDPAAARVFGAYKAERDRQIAALMAAEAGNPRRFALRRAIQQRYRARLPRVDHHAVLRHIDHVVRLVGADHVGIGSDFDGMSGMVPAGLEDVSKVPTLVRGLVALGRSEAEVRKIMGENLLRVMRRAEAVARGQA